ncbi:MAG: class I adenylate-forming enzyme family protein [Bdellovibrionales bacterium]
MIELDWLKRWKLYAPDSIALQEGETKRCFTYSELFDLSVKAAELLAERYRIRKGDRVAVFSQNRSEYVALFFGLQRLGAILVPLNFRLTSREVNHILGDCAPKMFIYESEFESLVAELDPVNRSEVLSFDGFCAQLATIGVSKAERFEGRFDDPCMIIYTAGTTGFPKGAIVTPKMMFWNSTNTTMRLNLTDQDVTPIFLPMFHTSGWHVLTTPFFHRGGKIILLKKFDADLILKICEEEKVTVLFGVPTTMDRLVHSTRFASADLSHIRYAIVGGEPMPIELINIWEKKGIPIRQGYGLTEFGPNVFSLNERDSTRKIGSIGFPNFYVDAKVVDDHGLELAREKVGELILRGPSCTPGYWNHPEASAEAIKGGWFFTGDLVKQDEEGYFYVVGRKKDMYKSGGENVYPAEIENVIHKLKGIHEVAVVGVPDEKWGEVGRAFVSLETGFKISQEDVLKHCQINLARFKIPTHVVFLEDLPKSESGKVLKRKLLEMAST